MVDELHCVCRDGPSQLLRVQTSPPQQLHAHTEPACMLGAWMRAEDPGKVGSHPNGDLLP